MSSSSSQFAQLYLQDQEIKKLQYSIAIVTIILSCFAIFLTIIFFIFNIRYRNFRLIKMSSPNINNIINFNCILLYTCPILNSIKGLYITNELLANIMCQVNTWILPLSSTAIYAAMLTKAWRIYKIFETTPKAKKIVIKDLRLVFYILCLMAFDALIVALWQFLDPIKLKPRYVYEIQTQPTQVILPSSYFTKSTSAILSSSSISTAINTELGFGGGVLDRDQRPSTNFSNRNANGGVEFDELMAYLTTTAPLLLSAAGGGGVEASAAGGGGGSSSGSFPVVQNYSQKNQLKLVFECNSNYNEVWITILTMYKIILLMYGIYLAWIIRNINVPSMNDSKYLLLSTYTIIVCGLGSMTLMQLLSNWPDVVQAFFTIGIILSTCTTQCLLFIPKIRLWYKRKNDDNFKISLSQIFLHTSSNCYYPQDKQNRNSANPTTANMLNIEDELCELLHENSQLKNFLKEKEEIIKLLQDKIRMAKAKLFQVTTGNNIDTQKKSLITNASCKASNENGVCGGEVATEAVYEICHSKTNSSTLLGGNNTNCANSTESNNNTSSNAYFNLSTSLIHKNNNPNNQQQQQLAQCKNSNGGLNNLDSGYDVDSSTCTTTTTTETLRTSCENQQQGCQTAVSKSQQSLLLYNCSTSSSANKHQFQHQMFTQSNTEQLKNDLDEVEELTTRVRDSISIDLSNTRRYSPLLYEYYRKQLELAKSIQCTYNIQCNTLFDAMTLMRKCLKDYCQTVHNPEYLAIDAITAAASTNLNSHNHEYTYTDFLSENNLSGGGGSGGKVGGGGGGASSSLPFSKQILLNSSRLKSNLNIVETTPVSSTSSSGSTSFASTCSISSSSLNTNKNNLFNNNNYESTNLETTTTTTLTNKPPTIDNKQTYV